MTSVYHRRFYPDDVDGTVAYVAPHNAGLDDPRYVDFLDQVGDAPCRQHLQDFQREVLLRRPEMLARMQDQAGSFGITYDITGIEPAFEGTVIGLAFGFWQYHGADRCVDVPTAAATDDEVWAFFDEIGSPWASSDSYALQLEPYYWQAYTQLGTPGFSTAHLDDLLEIDFTTIDDLPSIAEEPVFDPAAISDVAGWLAGDGSRLLFVYGETDPWSAGAFDLGRAQESYRFFAPGGNHGAQMLDLVPAERDQALAALEAWTGVTPDTSAGEQLKAARPPLRLLRQLRPR
jgi:hypothetical protein